jgi:uncharacterized protein YndB with AHSA1/START domain
MVTAVAPERQAVSVARTFQAPVAEVYDAFTKRDSIRDWLSDGGEVRAAVGGHILLTWQGGAHVTGAYTALDKNERAAFSWRGLDDTQETQVEARLREADGATHLELTHTGFAPDANLDAIKQTWETRLDTLQTALEKGEDTRITERVIIGIYPDDFNADIAAKLGVPATEGTRVANVIPGYSAEAAGLQADDVVVEMNGKAVTDTTPIGTLVQGKKPGDSVEVAFYRGAEKHKVTVKLKGYPVPEAVADFVTLADRAADMYATLDAELAGLFQAHSEADAARKPAPKEWSANEVLAHLIMGERWMHNWLGTLMNAPEADGWSANHDARIAGVTAVHPTNADLLAELRRGHAETVAIVRNVPAETSKNILWWMNFQLDGMATHARQHMKQIQAALKAEG